MEKEIVWTETALNQLEDIYFYILEESKSDFTSDKVVDAISDSVKILSKHWEIYELDEMKFDNNGNYRAYETYSYRISYKISELSIEIIRVRHTSREPKNL